MSDGEAVRDIERMGPGSTVIAGVFALVIGGVVGLLATFAHAQWAPWGLVAGLAILVCLVAGFRLVFASRIVGAAAAVGFVVAGALLALPGAGAPILRLDGPAGWIWAVAPVVLAVVVLAMPWRGRASARA